MCKRLNLRLLPYPKIVLTWVILWLDFSGLTKETGLLWLVSKIEWEECLFQLSMFVWFKAWRWIVGLVFLACGINLQQPIRSQLVDQKHKQTEAPTNPGPIQSVSTLYRGCARHQLLRLFLCVNHQSARRSNQQVKSQTAAILPS